MRRFLFGLAFLAIVAPLAHANDDQIAQRIVKSLKASQATGNLKNFNIGLRVQDGEVFLSGHVANAHQERLALATAQATQGVEQVFSEIEVRKVALKVAKPVVTRPVVTKPAPISPKLTPAPMPEVHVGNQVGDDAELRVKQALLENVPTETALPANTLSDAKEIASQIIRQLRQEKAQGTMRGFGIDVEVDRGVVWLKGRVSSAEQETLALEIARTVPGVKQVVNDLSISAPVQLAEASAPVTSAAAETATQVDRTSEIAQIILKRLQQQKQDGNLQNFGIDVHVDQDVVWLSGYVANKGQQMLALDMARFVPGVKQVVNDLSIASDTDSEEIVVAAPAELQADHANAILPTGATQAIAQTPATQTQTINGRRYALVPVQHVAQVAQSQTPLAFAPARPVSHTHTNQVFNQGSPVPEQMGAPGGGIAPARFDHPQMPGYAWPSYAPHPNYGAVTYPKQYSASAWPYIGPFYPYPQVPLGWRKVTLEWDDGWWQLDFKNRHH